MIFWYGGSYIYKIGAVTYVIQGMVWNTFGAAMGGFPILHALFCREAILCALVGSDVKSLKAT